jgi:hypothetical protein
MLALSRNTSYEIINANDNQNKPATSNDVTDPFSISLYVLRYADPNEHWKIQALFPDDVKFDFMAGRVLNYQGVSLFL